MGLVVVVVGGGSTGGVAEGTSEPASLTGTQLCPRPNGSSLGGDRRKKNHLQLPLKLSFRDPLPHQPQCDF